MKKLILLFTLLLSASVVANVKIIKSNIEFSAKGRPAFIKANGSAPLVDSNLIIKDLKLKGSVTVDISKLDSGIELRDEHLKEKYLHTNKFPQAVLIFDEQSVSLDGSEQTLKGKLKFHGVEKNIQVKAELNKNDREISLESNFVIKITDYGIELPSFQGITAADKVELKVEAELEI